MNKQYCLATPSDIIEGIVVRRISSSNAHSKYGGRLAFYLLDVDDNVLDKALNKQELRDCSLMKVNILHTSCAWWGNRCSGKEGTQYFQALKIKKSWDEIPIKVFPEYIKSNLNRFQKSMFVGTRLDKYISIFEMYSELV